MGAAMEAAMEAAGRGRRTFPRQGRKRWTPSSGNVDGRSSGMDAFAIRRGMHGTGGRFSGAFRICCIGCPQACRRSPGLRLRRKALRLARLSGVSVELHRFLRPGGRSAGNQPGKGNFSGLPSLPVSAMFPFRRETGHTNAHGLRSAWTDGVPAMPSCRAAGPIDAGPERARRPLSRPSMPDPLRRRADATCATTGSATDLPPAVPTASVAISSTRRPPGRRHAPASAAPHRAADPAAGGFRDFQKTSCQRSDHAVC
jgi:hypothetical protein